MGKSKPVKTCGGGLRCTLDEGHKGPCVQQRMPRGIEYDTRYEKEEGEEAFDEDDE